MKGSIIGLLLGLTTLMVFGCGGGGGGGISSDPFATAVVTLSADAVDNTTTVGTVVNLTADVKSVSGVAVKDDTMVTFSTDKGTLSATSAKTVNGKATITITITSSIYTSATITATVDGKSSSTTVLFDDQHLPATVSLAKSLSQSMIGRDVTIAATVKNGAGVAVPDGTTVQFVSTGGILSAASAITIGGVATVTLFSNATGNFTVTGSVTTAKGTISGTSDVAYVPVSVSLAADAAGNTANVGSVVNITATVTLPGGVPVPDGTSVSFATTKGNLSAASATTNGKATVTIDSGVYVQATVTATAVGVTASTTITFNDPALPATVNLSSTLPQSPIGFPVTVSAVVKNSNGVAVADGTMVNFVATGGNLSAASAVTTDGAASFTLTSNNLGTIKITGTVTTPAGDPQGTADVSFVPVMVALTADTVGTVNTGSVVTLTTDVKLPSGGATPDGTPVSFAKTGNTANLSATSVTTLGGKAVVTLTGTSYGPVTVSATAAGVSAQANVMFDDPTLPATINLDHTPSLGFQNNPAGLTVSATVRDGIGNPVADGTLVNFTSNGGTLASATPTAGGVAKVNLVSGVLGTIRVTGSVTSVKGTISGTDDIALVLPSFNLIAHRGYGLEAPENTIAAFNKALALGATTLECDLQISSDGGVIIMHDPTVDRTTTGTGAVSSLTTAAIRSLDAGTKFNESYAGEKVPLLSEFIAMAQSHPAIRILPEIKGSRTVADIALMVQPIIDAGLESRTTFQSFRWSDFSYVRSFSSTVRIAYVCSTLADFNSAITLAKADGRADIFINYLVVLSNPEIVAQATAAGVGLTVWTVYSWDAVQQLQLSGVANIMSDWGLAKLMTK